MSRPPQRERYLAPSTIMRTTPNQAGGGRHREALVEHARIMIEEGSKSFSFASMLFDKTTRERVWLLYAWCRRCDDLADGQEMGGELGVQSDPKKRLRAIRLLTQRALDGQPTADPAFDALGLVASECGISREMTEDVIAGFALDARDWRPRDEGDLMQYCYHVAGAVGVMMAKIMGVHLDDEDTLDRACDLGLAFQLANIARDVSEDDAADRCYLPVEWLVRQDIEPGQHMKPHHRKELHAMAVQLTTLMDTHASASRIGAHRLPFRSRWAVLSAARIYAAIGHKVRDQGPEAWLDRVHTSNLAKLGHVFVAFFETLGPAPKLKEMPRWNRRDLAERGRAA